MRRAGNREGHQPVITPDAMVLMHHQVALGDFSGLRDKLIGPLAGARRAGNAFAQQILLTDNGEITGHETTLNPQRDQGNAAGLLTAHRVPVIFLGRVLETVFMQQIGQPLPRAARPGRHHHALAGTRPAIGIAEQLLKHRHTRRVGIGGEDRPGPRAAIDTRALRHGEGRKDKRWPARQHRIPAGAVQVKKIRRHGAIRDLAFAGWLLAGGKMVRDHFQPRRQYFVGLVIQTNGRARQIIQQGFHGFMEQRHEMLDPWMPAPIGHRLIDRIVRRPLAKKLPPFRAKPADRILPQRHFGHGAQRDLLHFRAAALRRGIETANALNRVAEQIEAHRLGLPGRENIDNAAADGIFPWFHHRAGARITMRFQKSRQHLRRYRLIGGQHMGRADKRGTRRHALHQGIHRGQHDARFCRFFQQPRQGGNPLRHQHRVGGNAVVRQAIPGGKAQDFRFRHKERQRLRQPRHARIVARRVHHRASELRAATGQQQRVEAFRGTIHSNHRRASPASAASLMRRNMGLSASGGIGRRPVR